MRGGFSPRGGRGGQVRDRISSVSEGDFVSADEAEIRSREDGVSVSKDPSSDGEPDIENTPEVANLITGDKVSVNEVVTEGEGKKGKSWASLFTLKGQGGQGEGLDFVEPTIMNGKKVAWFSESVMKEAAMEWEFSVVGYFLGRRPSLSYMEQAVKQMWPIKGNMEVKAWLNGIFLFKFSNEEDQAYVLEQGPWHIAKNPMILRPWSQDMCLEKIGLKSIPLWFTLPGLPLHYWSKEGLSAIGSVIGKPIRMDRMSASKERIAYARVCVEVFAENELPEEVELWSPKGNVIQKI